MFSSRTIAKLFFVGLTVLNANTVFGQDYPNKPVHLVTSGAGGGSDFITRQVAQGITAPLGQPMVVDNRASLLAAEAVSKAAPDGYTLLVQGSVLWVVPLLRKAAYDAVKDFSPISLLTREFNILAVHPSLPVKSVQELIALAKARPGELNLGTGPTASALHLAGELFKAKSGANIVVVPYKNNAAQVTALLSGEVQFTILDASLVEPLAKSGKVRSLAVTSAQPTPLLPGLPTVAATGLPGYEAVGMTGILAPAKTPGAIITRLNQEVVRFLSTQDAKEKFFSAGAEAAPSSPEQFAEIIRADIATMGKVIKDSNIKLE